jgi:hypothetical protein
MPEWLPLVFFLLLAGVLSLAFCAGHARGYLHGYRAGRDVRHELETIRRRPPGSSPAA